MRLPAYDDLSKEQDAVTTLPLDGRYLIAGAPGTGKTVVALYRASRMVSREKPPVMLTYSRLLTEYVKASGLPANVTASMNTYHSWLYRYFRANYRQPPMKKPDSTYDHDWQAIFSHMSTRPPQQGKTEYMLIDEGQDLPKELYLILSTFVSQHLTVFADENQRITTDQSTMQEICHSADIHPRDIYYLKRNYRNTREIHDLACHFHRGSPTGLAEAPERPGERPVAVGMSGLKQQVDWIRAWEARNSDQSIGVLVRKKSMLRTVLSMLAGTTVNDVHAFDRDNGMQPEFDRAGITILCYQSSKGLEFDTVFLLQTEDFTHLHLSQDDEMMRLYVLCTRAREHLFLLYTGQSCPLVESIPSELLERRQV
ncbi:DUF2075 domain-containing protein [Deinococcus cavernae]|uniref:DUF2075 domain-containing protein n=1 Tax=Deinococcus cavernae TaxID=2320857 RepID=A0A418VES5_9DEIO|nr:3'-5' exonuclease [Deinococcus cavernae]RJF74612.1 DUF2075 domain-containing protein [Deinococcus cavernae]